MAVHLDTAGATGRTLGDESRSGVPLVVVADAWIPPRPEPAFTISGRDNGLRWAIRHLVAEIVSPPTRHRYGSDPSHVADLRVPPGPGPHPVCVLIHGGGWRSHWARDLMDPLAVDLTAGGFATWNIEYRRAGATGGGYPATFLDVAAAVDALAGLGAGTPLDLSRVTLAGHSAGGHLSLWAAARPQLAAGEPGAAPRVTPAAVVALASVYDLVETEAANISRNAVGEFLGGTSAELGDLYRWASPTTYLPLGVPQLLVHGLADESVPVELTERYAKLAHGKGDDVEVMTVPGAAHLDVVESTWEAWPAVAAWMSPD